MPDKLVTLDYAGNVFKANPDPVFVKPGDTVTFQLGSGAPSNSAFTVTIHDRTFFSGPGGDGSHAKTVVVTVTKPLPAAGQDYDCELRDSSGKILSKSGGGQPGGGMKPGT